MCEPIGFAEVAARLRVAPGTVRGWHRAGQMPAPRWYVNGSPAWDGPEVEAWAQERAGAPTVAVSARRLASQRWDDGDLEQLVAACRLAGSWSSISEAARLVGVSHRTMSQALARAVRAGVLEEVGAGNRLSYRVVE